MATYSQPVEEALKRFIRDQRAIDPLISYGALVENVSKRFNREFDQRYIKKLTDKIERQMFIEVDRAKIEERMRSPARTTAWCARNCSRLSIGTRRPQSPACPSRSPATA